MCVSIYIEIKWHKDCCLINFGRFWDDVVEVFWKHIKEDTDIYTIPYIFVSNVHIKFFTKWSYLQDDIGRHSTNNRFVEINIKWEAMRGFEVEISDLKPSQKTPAVFPHVFCQCIFAVSLGKWVIGRLKDKRYQSGNQISTLIYKTTSSLLRHCT